MRILARQPLRADIERAFAAFTDIEHSAGRVAGITRVEVVSAVRSGVGLRWLETRTLFGSDATVEKRLTAVDPPRSFRVESHVEGVDYVSVFEFAESAGVTVATWTHDLTPTTLRAKLASPLMLVLRGVLRRAMSRDLADLAAFLEREPGAIRTDAPPA